MPIIDKVAASKLINEYSQVYSKSIMEDAFPHCKDGLKKVHRRIIFTNKDEGLVSSARFVANVKINHDHGDQGIYDAAVRMAQPWECNPTLVTIGGNMGSYSGDSAAAMRYTASSISEFSKEVFFKDVNKRAIAMTDTEDFTGSEPVSLIPALPMALLFPNLTIGYGHGSRTLPLSIENLATLIESYANHIKMHGKDIPWDYKPHVHLFVPDIPIANYIENYDDIIAAYKEGNFFHKVEFGGTVDIFPDLINVKTLPFSIPYADCEQKYQEAELHSKDSFADKNIVSGIATSSEDGNNREGRFVVPPKKNADIIEIYRWLEGILRLHISITPNPNYVLNQQVVKLDPPTIIALWYKDRRDTLLVSKRHNLAALTKNHREVETYLIVCDKTDEVVKIIRQNTVPEAHLILQERFGLTPMQATILTSARLTILSKTSRIELEEKKREIMTAIELLKQSFKDVDNEIVETAKHLALKYGDGQRQAIIPDYIGFVKINNGIIQFETQAEASSLITNFSGTKYNVSVYQYQPGMNSSYLVEGNKATFSERLPKRKITFADNVISYNKSGYSIWFADGSACYVDSVVNAPDQSGQISYTGHTVTTVAKNGVLKRDVKVSETFTKRKTLPATGSKTNLIYAYTETSRQRYLFVYSAGNKNNVTIYKITPELKKILTYVNNDTYIDTTLLKKNIFLNVPQKYLNRCSTKIILIKDIETLLDGKSSVTISLNKKIPGVDRW